MTMTGLRVDVVPVKTETDEAEIAAAIASVFAVLKQRQTASCQFTQDPTGQTGQTDQAELSNGGSGETSENWGKASRLEGTGQGQVLQALKPLSRTRSAWWSARSGLLSIISVGIAVTLSIFSAGSATAQDYDGETDLAGGEIATAPSFQRSLTSAVTPSLEAATVDSQPMPSMASLPGPSYARPSIDGAVALPSYPVSQLLPSRSGQIMRVLITRGGRAPEIACLDGATITALDSLSPVAEITAGSRFVLKSEGSRLAFGGSDLFSVAKTTNAGPIRQVVAMTPRLPLGGYERLAGTVNKF